MKPTLFDFLIEHLSENPNRDLVDSVRDYNNLHATGYGEGIDPYEGSADFLRRAVTNTKLNIELLRKRWKMR